MNQKLEEGSGPSLRETERGYITFFLSFEDRKEVRKNEIVNFQRVRIERRWKKMSFSSFINSTSFSSFRLARSVLSLLQLNSFTLIVKKEKM